MGAKGGRGRGGGGKAEGDKNKVHVRYPNLAPLAS